MYHHFKQFSVSSFATAAVFLLSVVVIMSAPLRASTANFAVPDDTALRIRPDDTLTSVDSKVGDPFRATGVDQDSGKIRSHTSLLDRFDRLAMPVGRRSSIQAEIIELYTLLQARCGRCDRVKWPRPARGLGTTALHERQKITLNSGQEMLIRVTGR